MQVNLSTKAVVTVGFRPVRKHFKVSGERVERSKSGSNCGFSTTSTTLRVDGKRVNLSSKVLVAVEFRPDEK